MTRILPLALSLVLAGLIALAAGIGDFGAAGDWLFSHPWGWVTLADLYAGFILIALVIGFFERSWVKRLVWDRPALRAGQCLGGPLAGLAAPELLRRLSGP